MSKWTSILHIFSCKGTNVMANCFFKFFTSDLVIRCKGTFNVIEGVKIKQISAAIERTENL